MQECSSDYRFLQMQILHRKIFIWIPGQFTYLDVDLGVQSLRH